VQCRRSVTHVPGQECYLCTRFVPGGHLTRKCSCRGPKRFGRRLLGLAGLDGGGLSRAPQLICMSLGGVTWE
jgi:hypothetical protein